DSSWPRSSPFISAPSASVEATTSIDMLFISRPDACQSTDRTLLCRQWMAERALGILSGIAR
ncbi:MAG: hypothetical protein VB852_10275, partial [Deltaproteobacteria bacterium]